MTNEEKRAYDKEYYQKNKAKILARKKDYQQEHKEQRALYNKEWGRNNRDIVAKHTKNWMVNNKDKCNATRARYRARKESATVSWVDEGLVSVKYWYAQWLSQTVGVPYEVDHIVPLQGNSICGLHCEDNLQVITREANRSKCNRWEEE